MFVIAKPKKEERAALKMPLLGVSHPSCKPLP